jgi:acetyl-CoA acetyltransferase
VGDDEPAARYQEPITVDDVLASPMQASPLHLLDCCLVTDGAGAFVMTSAEQAGTAVPVYVLGVMTAGDHVSP